MFNLLVSLLRFWFSSLFWVCGGWWLLCCGLYLCVFCCDLLDGCALCCCEFGWVLVLLDWILFCCLAAWVVGDMVSGCTRLLLCDLAASLLVWVIRWCVVIAV